MQRIDRLGVLLSFVGALALALLPLVVFKANRIVPGEPRALLDLVPTAALALYFTLAVAAAVAVFIQSPRVRLLAALIGIAALAVAVASAADILTPAGNRVVRVAPGAGFWIVLIALGLLATDALTRLRPGPVLRVATLAVFLAATLAALGSGFFDDLSIMREYAVNATRFAHEAQRHLLLALGSLGAAVIVALPLGVLCHRAAATARRRARRAERGADDPVDRAVRHPDGAAGGAGAGVSSAGCARHPRHRRRTRRHCALSLFLAADRGQHRGRPRTRVARRRRRRARHGHDRRAGPAADRVAAGVADRSSPASASCWCRTSAWSTIAALIGGGGFGAFVFQGIGQTAIDLVLLGAIPTVVLAFSAAVVLDALIDLTRRVPR